jgi:hypothetical protein
VTDTAFGEDDVGLKNRVGLVVVAEGAVEFTVLETDPFVRRGIDRERVRLIEQVEVRIYAPIGLVSIRENPARCKKNRIVLSQHLQQPYGPADTVRMRGIRARIFGLAALLGVVVVAGGPGMAADAADPYVPPCSWDAATATLTLTGTTPDPQSGRERILTDTCSVPGVTDVESAMRRVEAYPQSGKAVVVAQYHQTQRTDLTWRLHAPAGVKAPDLVARVELDPRIDGAPWKVKGVAGGLVLDGDGIPNIEVDDPTSWSWEIATRNATGTINLSRATPSTTHWSYVYIASKKAIAGATVIGPRNGAGLVVSGGPRNDVITTYQGDDVVSGGAGNDVITTGAGDDSVGGGQGNDAISTGAGQDRVHADIGVGLGTAVGPPGNDVVRVGSGTNYVLIQNGHDSVIGGPGTDVVQVFSPDATRDRRQTLGNLSLGGGRDYVDMGAVRLVRRIDCGSGRRDTVLGSATGTYSINLARLHGCEAVGPFRLIVNFIFPYTDQFDKDGLHRVWICRSHVICPAGRR